MESDELCRWRAEAVKLDRLVKSLVDLCRPTYLPGEVREVLDTTLSVSGRRVPLVTVRSATSSAPPGR